MLEVVMLVAVPYIAYGALKDLAKLLTTHGYAYMSFSKGGQKIGEVWLKCVLLS